jgi:hypothetical protein
MREESHRVALACHDDAPIVLRILGLSLRQHELKQHPFSAVLYILWKLCSGCPHIVTKWSPGPKCNLSLYELRSVEEDACVLELIVASWRVANKVHLPGAACCKSLIQCLLCYLLYCLLLAVCQLWKGPAAARAAACIACKAVSGPTNSS